MSPQQTKKLIAEPEPLDIDLSRTAVVVVDMQNAFIKEGGIFDLMGLDISPFQKVIEPINNICSLARKNGLKVIYIAHTFSPDMREVGPGASFWYKSPAKFRANPQWRDKFIIRGTWGAEIIDELRPQEGDIVSEKIRFNAFFGTNLDVVLKTYDLKYLLFVGCATNICVEASIRGAADLGYFPVLISDATMNNGPPFMQEATIFNVKLCFGWVTDTENLMAVLK